MHATQRKLHSGFGRSSTAEEVLRGIRLDGKRVLVTGGYSGLGLETTRALVHSGASVVIPARRPEAARTALAGVANVEIAELDLANLASVRRFATTFVASGCKLDLIINNAAVMACPETRVGPGWESQFGTNHLGHFALVNLLWPAIRSGARIVALSSLGHRRSAIRWDDIHFREGYDKWLAYGQSKTANALFALQLDSFARERGVRAYSVHPGGILTPLQRHLAREEMIAFGWIDEAGNVINTTFKTPAQGAATTLWAATSPRLQELGGVYCEDCDVADIVPEDSTASYGVRPHAIDPEEAARLWTLSAELTGVNAFARS